MSSANSDIANGWPPPRLCGRIDLKSLSNFRIEGACCATALIDRHGNHAGTHHAERACRGDGEIDDASTNERTAVVDAALDGTPAMADGEDAAHRRRPA